MRTTPRAARWARGSDDALLALRFDQLHLPLRGTWIERCVARLHLELARAGIRHRPHVWLSEEWFSPTGIPGFAVPFYLAHPRLMRLERAQMGTVEGGTVSECMAIMRHETGHAIQTAYRLHARPRWRWMFGRTTTPYPTRYRPDRGSRDFVRHLPRWYAQSHPDEDFAETFAVWLRRGSAWRRAYARWPAALAKLEYVDALMREVGPAQPLLASRRTFLPLRAIHRTLGAHYAAHRAHYQGTLAGEPRGWLPL